MRYIYRICDRSYAKVKLPGATKEKCLENFLSVFSPKKEELTIIADNCDDGTHEKLDGLGYMVFRTTEGNAGAVRFAMDLVVQNMVVGEWVYLVEDDYLHLPESKARLVQAAEAGIADYLTLYDHPDKYSPDYGGGEISRVMKVGNQQHWRTTQSTTMTFGVRVGTLKADRDLWQEFIGGAHPHDHIAFTALKRAGRTLAVAIPGLSCHVDLTWGMGQGRIAVEPWAIRMMAQG